MRAAARHGWRIAAVVAFGATAALAVTLTRGAPMHAALISARHQSAPRCVTSGLRISVGAGTSAAGLAVPGGSGLTVTRYALEFTNVSGAACTLGGFPEVAAYRGDDVPVGNAATADTTAPAHRVVLAPGASARAAMTASVPGSAAGSCRPVVATGLRVAPPGQSAALYIRHSLLACSTAGPSAPAFLSVRAVQPENPVVRPDSLAEPDATAASGAAAGRPRLRSRALRDKHHVTAAPSPIPPVLALGPAG